MIESDLKISISGIRGIVGRSLTPQLIIKFAEAFSTYIGGGKIGVGSDTRPSAEMVKCALLSGLLSGGASPIDCGILPIPSLQVYTREMKLDGAISISASHNPIEWNALKLIKSGGHFLYPYEAEELLDLYYQGKFTRVSFPGKIVSEKKAFVLHEKKILDFVDAGIIKKRKLKVVIDPCAGASTPYVVKFLEKLGTEVVCINCRPGGEFPRNPEPLAENIQKLCHTVRKERADVGFAQDADADRLAAVDETGTPIGEEHTLALAVDYYLQKKQKSPVVVNLSTSRVVEDVARRAGVKLFRSRVGEINVSRCMAQKRAKIGGEGNGGIIVSDIHSCRDSFSGMALLLEYVADSGNRLSELNSTLPHYFMIKDKKQATFREARRILNSLKHKFKQGKINATDGLRVDFPGYWFHVRPSNTEPVIRIVVEGKDEDAALKAYQKIMDEIRK
ncbi:MAG: phosphoglucosamine mutase [Candidatus Aminicenantales bacterium]